MNYKKPLIIGMLFVSLVACQETSEPPLDDNQTKVENPTDDNNAEIVNPIVDYSSLDELTQVGGINFNDYETITGILNEAEGNKITYQMIGEDIEQITINYENGASVAIRASKTRSGIKELGGYYFDTLNEEENKDNEPVHYVIDDLEVSCFSQEDVNFCIANVGAEANTNKEILLK